MPVFRNRSPTSKSENSPKYKCLHPTLTTFNGILLRNRTAAHIVGAVLQCNLLQTGRGIDIFFLRRSRPVIDAFYVSVSFPSITTTTDSTESTPHTAVRVGQHTDDGRVLVQMEMVLVSCQSIRLSSAHVCLSAPFNPISGVISCASYYVSPSNVHLYRTSGTHRDGCQ